MQLDFGQEIKLKQEACHAIADCMQVSFELFI
jgi:hypothetical protein